jgi:hypothetical protein
MSRASLKFLDFNVYITNDPMASWRESRLRSMISNSAFFPTIFWRKFALVLEVR